MASLRANYETALYCVVTLEKEVPFPADDALYRAVSQSADSPAKYRTLHQCQSCDQMYQKTGEWTELLLQKAQFKKVCGDCYSDCFWYQMDEAPHRVINDYQADHTDTEGLFDVADRFIDLANAEKKDIQHVSESFSYAAARYAAFEAVNCAKDAAKDKKVIIEFFTDRFKEMFVENLNDYMKRGKENQD